jgi:hypothetical protein
MRRRWWTFCFQWVVAVAWGSGCGPADDFQHVGVSGKVMLDGKPLPSGTITFMPLTSGAAAHAPITDGSYSISRSSGPSPGSYRVEISSMQSTGRQVPNNDEPGKMMPETINAVPARYNLKSELKADIKEGADQQLDYTLEPAK